MVQFLDGDKGRAEYIYNILATPQDLIRCRKSVMEEEITHDLDNLGLL